VFGFAALLVLQVGELLANLVTSQDAPDGGPVGVGVVTVPVYWPTAGSNCWAGSR